MAQIYLHNEGSIMARKKIITVLFIAIAVFSILNDIWLISVAYPYFRYEKNMLRRYTGGSSIEYIYTDREYEYEIKPPMYLGFSSGFLRVSPIEETRHFVEESTQGRRVYYLNSAGDRVYDDDYRKIEFYYWKKPFGDSIYGIMYWSVDLDAQILFDKDFNVINGEDAGYKEEFQSVIDKEKGLISEMMNRAADMWELKY